MYKIVKSLIHSSGVFLTTCPETNERDDSRFISVVKVAWRQRPTTPTRDTRPAVTSPARRWLPTSTAPWNCPKTRRVGAQEDHHEMLLPEMAGIMEPLFWLLSFCCFLFVFIPTRNCRLACWERTRLCSTECVRHAGRLKIAASLWDNSLSERKI